MENPNQPPLDELLKAARSGDEAAAAELWKLVYADLRQLAQSRMQSLPPGQTLQATALVNEAYLRLVGRNGEAAEWQNREHFFGAAARTMRNILVDQLRHGSRLKRGGDRARVALFELESEGLASGVDVLDLDGALTRLEAIAPHAAEVTVLRFFGGLTIAESAAELGVSEATIEREWAYARAWLRRDLGDEG